MATEVTNGRILIIPRGDYDSTYQYKMLDIVNEGGKSYIVKKTVPVGTAPSADTTGQYYQIIGNSSSSGGSGNVVSISASEPTGQKLGDSWLQTNYS